ncbi:MAG TPA: PqqD family peptide modification chaperone [Burkholderiales bacterium]|nr:PqqD family peptide modification chaperone [Burkholderiales bacterium]
MSTDLHSTSWYRVAELKPRLRSHVRIHRHHYRGELWYVLEDRVSRRMHRFNPVSHYVIGLMDGHRSVQEIWDSATTRFGDDAPTQDEMIRLLGQLHAAEVLQSEVTPDVAELLRRAQRLKRRKWLQYLLSPLSIRIPLFDPDRLLERWLPWYRPLFGWTGVIVWCAVVGLAIFTAAAHWAELTENVTDRVLAPQNLLLMWLTFPVLKALHEFGHACATKAWGGEVHEMGIMILVLVPIPYVDASAASAFREPARRVVIGAAGMIVELFVASLALFLWLQVEPGITRAVLFDVMLIAGVSTVLFNANPLLRFDGYYMLADLTQIPNLRARAHQYLGYLAETRLFGLRLPEFEASNGERTWFVLFAIASFIYRTFLMIAIALFVASEYLVIGVVLALWVAVTSFVVPVAKGIGYLVLHPKLRRHRVRALAVSGAVSGAVAMLLFLAPFPLWTRAEGVIWVPHDAHVRAAADGFIREVAVAAGARVRKGVPLVVAEDRVLVARVRVLEAQLRLLEARAQAELRVDRVRWELTREAIGATRAELTHARQLAAELTIRSPATGKFMPAVATQDLPDRYVRKGQAIGYVVPDGSVTALVLVSHDDVDLVRTRTERVRVKLAGRVYDTFEASIRREVPAASDRLPNLALSSIGGGPVPVDPGGDPRDPKALSTWFQFELDVPGAQAFLLGEHAYVRFEHGWEPLAWRIYRSIRQLFMRQFTV